MLDSGDVGEMSITAGKFDTKAPVSGRDVVSDEEVFRERRSMVVLHTAGLHDDSGERHCQSPARQDAACAAASSPDDVAGAS